MFDDFTRAIGGASTRRRFSGKLAALGLGSITGLGLLGADDAAAKNKKKRKRRRRRRNRGGGDSGTVPPPPPTCVPDCTAPPPFGTKQCGSDGCGGTCGTCALLTPVCNSITFTCEPIV